MSFVGELQQIMMLIIHEHNYVRSLHHLYLVYGVYKFCGRGVKRLRGVTFKVEGLHLNNKRVG